MNGATDDNRLSREERELLASIRRWFRYRTPENLRHVVNAARDWIRAEHRREDDARGPRGCPPTTKRVETPALAGSPQGVANV